MIRYGIGVKITGVGDKDGAVSKLKKKDIAKLPDSIKIKLIKYGFKHLDWEVSTHRYYNQSNLKECALWHDIMRILEE